jgi:hypothetical protein
MWMKWNSPSPILSLVISSSSLNVKSNCVSTGGAPSPVGLKNCTLSPPYVIFACVHTQVDILFKNLFSFPNAYIYLISNVAGNAMVLEVPISPIKLGDI